MKKAILVLALGAIAMTAMSTGAFHQVFLAKYKPGKDSKIGKANCLICHASPKGGKLNAYGKDVKAAAKGGKVTAAVLASIEGKDSNGDGVKNGDSIKKDILP